MWVFKLAGILLIVFVSTCAGFFEAGKLKKREEKLRQIGGCLRELKERIRLAGGELSRLLNESFSDSGIIEIHGSKLSLCDSGISPEDKRLLREYFDSAGMADADAECDRVQLYITLFDKQYDDAKKKAGELCRLYRSAGFLVGVFLCIFFV